MSGFFGKCTPHYMKRSVASMGWSVVIALLGAMFSICTDSIGPNVPLISL